MLRIVNLLENLPILVNIAEKDEIVGGSGFNRTKNLSKSQKLKSSIILSNIDASAKLRNF